MALMEYAHCQVCFKQVQVCSSDQFLHSLIAECDDCRAKRQALKQINKLALLSSFTITK